MTSQFETSSGERAVLVGLKLPGVKADDLAESLAELGRLAGTAGAVAVETIIQRRPAIEPATFIGRGKAEELRDLVRAKDIHTVIFDDDLKPGQQRQLEEIIEAKIIDRTRLILDIFAQRARSREGILQVERAQLAYYLPRLSKQGIFLDSQVGGIGTRGPGERKLEVDQRRIRDRITQMDREIERISRQREILRARRGASGQPVVAIVGYTNAGKSTLLNALTHSGNVYADDKLFATLDPTTRQVRLPGGRVVLFTDTVGFIRKLPHTLIAAFRATLEEITRADCLIHLIDVSHPDYGTQVATVLRVLRELDAEHVPVINVYNKADRLSPAERRRHEAAFDLLISAATGEGIDELLARLAMIVTPRLRAYRLKLSYRRIADIAAVYRLAVVKKQSYTRQGITMDIETTPEQWEKLQHTLNAGAPV